MPHGSDGESASASRSYRACSRLALWWLRRYTRSVDPRAAFDRTLEVELELWEHAIVADRRSSAVPAAASLLLQTAAGVPQDLRWRRAVLTEPLAWLPPPVRPMVRQHRERFWVPLRAGHVFDQTNGMAPPDER